MNAVSSQQTRPLVAVIATGGTIASQRGASGASTPSLTGESLLSFLPEMHVGLKPVELMAKDSASLTLADMQAISDAVGREQDDPAVAGIVVLHGTDAMEETAFLVHLQHVLRKPVIFTGAQFTADHPDSDGPANLAAAISLASRTENAQQGVRVCFGGRNLPARALYKHASDNSDAFRLSREPDCLSGQPLAGRVGDIRVDIVAIYPGCDAAHIEASLAAGARGIILAALGSGNANPCIVEAVSRCSEKGVRVVVSSRVPVGELVPGYGGGGGGHDMAAVGAIHSRTLRPGQARILLAALLASGATEETLCLSFNN